MQCISIKLLLWECLQLKNLEMNIWYLKSVTYKTIWMTLYSIFWRCFLYFKQKVLLIIQTKIRIIILSKIRYRIPFTTLLKFVLSVVVKFNHAIFLYNMKKPSLDLRTSWLGMNRCLWQWHAPCKKEWLPITNIYHKTQTWFKYITS